ncbi:MAG: ABC transporter substrate-binding protein [Planctomycetota bacterium]
MPQFTVHGRVMAKGAGRRLLCSRLLGSPLAGNSLQGNSLQGDSLQGDSLAAGQHLGSPLRARTRARFDRGRAAFIGICALAAFAALSTPVAGSETKVLQIPMRTDGPKSLDPVRGSTTYDNTAACQVYETLLQYKYLARPAQLEPLLLTEMPQVSEDRLTYHFKLKPGVRFHDDPCFPDGKGRELEARDVFYSWKRMADPKNDPKSWWLFEDTIVGFDEYRSAQRAAPTFDYEAPVAGFELIGRHEFRVRLKQPVYRFLWVLAMFQTSIVPREAVEHYGSAFGRNPVGTGPFTLEEKDWAIAKSMVFHRNVNYHECTYPTEHEVGDEALGFHIPAGKRLPIVDRVEISMFVEDQPMWLEFMAGRIGYTQVPAENTNTAFRKLSKAADGNRLRLQRELKSRGIVHHSVPLLDYIFKGFNMEDPLLGGYTDKGRQIRQAICHALDWEETNDTFYEGLAIVYDGPIPPNLDGHPPGHVAPISYVKGNLDKARELLASAGYPEGAGFPTVEYYVSRGGNSQEQSEQTRRQLEKIGIQLNVRLVDFSALIEAINNKKAPFFSFAWGSDYPDAENNLALFYGPNESPGSNHFNYKNPAYDALYRQIISMGPSPERTQIYERMRDMVLTDCPAAGSLARTREYLVQPWLANFKPSEDFYNWIKYLDVDDSKRP